ncbi:hypothetical protein NRIC_12990 [Enterococcus florum]|uniref:Uncharacterized protein n=1 Tax=Enterococcus florum TaxID=2480627 RepID=A0A4P5PBT7_9ENTE|nr:hypothetical protein [Enterococcus florum]GCF93408.1 hypothetical protein NRIC_12990 [Enterococcus florum]
MKNRAKEFVTEAAERIYDLLKDNHYEVTIHSKDKRLKVRQVRPTRHTIKWKAKNH